MQLKKIDTPNTYTWLS